MSKALIILTEGSQDAAFIYRLLLDNDFENYDKIQKELPYQLKSIITEHIQEKFPDEVDKDYKTMMFLPFIVTNKAKDVYTLIYSIEGVNNYENCKSIMLKYFRFIFNPLKRGEHNIDKFSFAIIFDSDASESKAIENFKAKYSSISDQTKKRNEKGEDVLVEREPINFAFANIKHSIEAVEIRAAKGNKNEKINFGFYFLPGTLPNIGTLDFLTFPLLKQANETIFENTATFVRANKEDFTEPQMFINEQNEKGVAKTAKYYKTIIGVAGQLKSAGNSNASFYKDSIYLSKEKMQGGQCQEIIHLINNLLQ